MRTLVFPYFGPSSSGSRLALRGAFDGLRQTKDLCGQDRREVSVARSYALKSAKSGPQAMA